MSCSRSVAVVIPALLCAVVLSGAGLALAAPSNPVRDPGQDVGSAALREAAGLQPGPSLLFNGWGVTPAGQSVTISDMPLKMVIAHDGRALAAVSGGFNRPGLSLLDRAGMQLSQFVPLQGAWNGIAFSRDGKTLIVAGGDTGKLYAFDYADGKVSGERSAAPAAGAAGGDTTNVFLAGIAAHPTTGKLYVCNEGGDEVWVVDPATLAREAVVPAGSHPHSCAFGLDLQHLYVSDWGDRTVSVIDTQTNRRVRVIKVGLRPNDLALAPDGRLFVACSGDNTVHVIQTRSLETPEAPASRTRRPPEGVREILSTSLYPASPEGSTPDGVAVSPDGKTLYVANADNNDVMAADISDPVETRVAGAIPTGWYPTAVAVSPDSGTLYVASGKGLRSTPSFTYGEDASGRKGHYTYIANLFQGTMSAVPRPDAAGLAAFTEQAQRNCPFHPEQMHQAAIQGRNIIPDRTGGACPIQYVLYIIKENRTYDQVFGDFRDAKGAPAGNGDPGLVMYGEKVTPNHHQLARESVLLDNLYCSGEVSVDGHSWCDAAIATDYNERQWILSYSKHGTLPGNDEMEDPAGGYLWDLCQRQGVSFKCYGEGASRVPNANRGTWPGGRDMNRVDGWIKDLKAAEDAPNGDLPHFMIMSLGEDHTKGATPGAPTPAAAVASNDLGLGKIVEAASHSRFWPKMAIFVIEDDAQNGPDHVDAHRTAGLVISPYARRGVVDSTLYSTASMVRTIELILGLPPLTQYDAAATPMFNCFQKKPQITPYVLRPAEIDVNAINPPKGPGAKESLRMDFREYDRAPADELNRVLWRLAKGPGTPYPAPHRQRVE